MDNKFGYQIVHHADAAIWESRIIAPDMEIASYTKEYNLRHYQLTAQPVLHNILTNLSIDALGYNGVTPGPLIIMKQGEWIYLTLENRLDEPTGLSIHGLAIPNLLNNTLHMNQRFRLVKPGESYTYKFLCWQSGTYFYQSSQDFQVSMGMMGAFIVLPKDQDIKDGMIPDQDYILLMQQWDIPQPQMGDIYPGVYKPDKFHRHPNYFTINGKCFPNTSPLYFRYGNKIRIRFVTKAGENQYMHFHGHNFMIANVNGFSRSDFMDDTIDLASGRRTDIDLIADNPGTWTLIGTKTFQQSNNGVAPGGLITKILYI
jgi:FtsP/CotA-like multicopper oxidase with cupredoxin domain